MKIHSNVLELVANNATKQSIKPGEVVKINDEVIKMADGFEKIAETENCFYAASQNIEKKIYTVQFHPEEIGNDYGDEIYHNFMDIVREDLV